MKQRVNVVSLLLKINLSTTIAIKRSRRELAIDILFIGVSSQLTKLRSSPVLLSYQNRSKFLL